MKIEEDCIPCILKMALTGMRSLNLSDGAMKTIYQKMAINLLSRENLWELTSAELVEDAIIYLRDEFGSSDLFSDIKQHTNNLLVKVYEGLKARVITYEDSLSIAIKLAIMGNTIDVMVGAHLDNLDEDLFCNAINLPVDEELLSELKSGLLSARKILYIGDNSCEAILDKLLIEVIRAVNPCEISYVVRSHPTLNDITYNDAIAIGLNQVAKVIENGINGPLPGTKVDRCSNELKDLFRQSDLVIVKGGGNFETLNDESGLNRNMFFLLMCKCPVHSRFFSRPVGHGVIWRP